MKLKYHLLDCDDEHYPIACPGTRSRFVPADIYEANYTLDTAACDNGNRDFIHVPCPYGRDCRYCSCRLLHLDAIFVAIDGACHNNGSTGARSSYGIYFAKGSQYNTSSIIQGVGTVHSSQKAELQACLAALHKVEDVMDSIPIFGFDEQGSLSKVIIKADSEYVVKGVTEWMPRWKRNGYRTVKGGQVVNAEVFRSIDEQIERLDGLGVRCLFWHVPRNQNQEADALANRALDERGLVV